MKLGDLVKIGPPQSSPPEEWFLRFEGRQGIIILDHSPMRPPDVGRVVEVLWSNGTIEDMYTHELEIISEAR